MNEALSHLQPYPFEKLAAISKDIEAPKTKQPIDLSIGEPKHSTPEFIIEEVSAHLTDLAKYPSTRGTDALREVFIDWLVRRYSLPRSSLSSDKNVLPVNGTREALFAIAQCVINRRRGSPLVLIPNPFYQIYEGATLLAGAEPWFVNCLPEFNFLPDFEVIPKTVWARCQLVYLCSPGNPTGSVLNLALFTELLELADRYEFIIAADECYSEIYLHEDQPPLGLLQLLHSWGGPIIIAVWFSTVYQNDPACPGCARVLLQGMRESLSNFCSTVLTTVALCHAMSRRRVAPPGGMSFT